MHLVGFSSTSPTIDSTGSQCFAENSPALPPLAGAGLQVPSRRKTWLTDPGHLSVRCVSMREGNCLEQISGLASEASYALIVAKPPHHCTFTMNKIFSRIYIWGVYIYPVSQRLQKGVAKSSGLGGGVERLIRAKHFTGFLLRLLKFEPTVEFHFPSQIPDPILPLTSCETLRKCISSL